MKYLTIKLKLKIRKQYWLFLNSSKYLYLLVACFFMSANFVKSQTLEEYQQLAAQNNLQLKAKFAQYQAALEKMPQAAGLPDPELSFNFFLMPMERYMGEQLGEISVMQMFPWFGALKAGKNEANFMAQMKFAEFMDVRNGLYHQVRLVWLDLYRTEEELKLLTEELELLRSLEQMALARYTTGATGISPAAGTEKPMNTTGQSSEKSAGGMAGMGNSGAQGNTMGAGNQSSGMKTMPSMASSSGGMVDVLMVQLQIKELENKILLLKKSRLPLLVNLNNILNRDKMEEVVLPDTLLPVALPAVLSVIEDSIKQYHPMLKMADWDAKARDAQLQMVQLMGRPMIGLGLSYMMFRPREVGSMEMAPMDNGKDMIMPMVTITLPIHRGKYKGQQNEAKILKQAAELEKQSAEKLLLTELEQLINNYESATINMSLLADQLQITHQAVRLLTTGYSVGNAGIDDIIRQRQNILNYRQQQIIAITDQHKAVSGIKQLMGR